VKGGENVKSERSFLVLRGC